MTALDRATTPTTFRRHVRATAAVASGGMLVGLGGIAAAPAVAATATDCTVENTLTAPTHDVADIQALLDLDAPIVCLEGTFTFSLDTPLIFNHNLTLFGLTDAVLDGDSGSGILEVQDGFSLTVQNITFVNGNAPSGGAISANGELIVLDSTFENNRADDDGGAIYVFNNAPVRIERSTFTSNDAVEDGGAVYVQTSDGDSDNVVDVIDSTFTDNTAGDFEGFGYAGGAIFSDVDDELTIEGSTFLRNDASAFGGAVYGNSVIVEQSTFAENTAQLGGGLYADSAALIESTFTENAAEEGGAATIWSYGVAIGSSFAENTAIADSGPQSGGVGGAISGGFGDENGVFVQNSTFVGNRAEGPASFGGAMAVGNTFVLLSTFLSNTAENADPDEQSDAIHLFNAEAEALVAGSIFAGNREVRQLGSSGPGAFVDSGGNVFTTLEATESALGDPDPSTQFGRLASAIFGTSPALADNGGPTQTLALVAGSPAIDAVPADLLTVTAATFAPASGALAPASVLQPAAVDPSEDQRGVVRTGLFDAGSYEFGVAEIAATGADEQATGWLAAIAALLFGGGVAALFVSRRAARTRR